MKNKFPLGTWPILIASVLWAFGYFARKTAMQDISPLLLNAIIAPIVAIFAFFYCRLSPKRLWDVMRGHPLRLFTLSLSGVVIGSTLMMVGLDRLDLGVATVLEKLQPIFTLFMAALFLKERFSPQLYPFCVLALLGAVFVSTPNPFAIHFFTPDVLGVSFIHSHAFGFLAIVGAAFSWGIASVTGRALVLKGISPQELTFFRFALAGVVMAPLFLFAGDGEGLALNLTPTSIGLLLAAGIISNGFGYILYYQGLQTVDATTANFLELITPAVALLLGFAFLHESLTTSQWLAIPVMLFAVYRISVGPKVKT